MPDRWIVATYVNNQLISAKSCGSQATARKYTKNRAKTLAHNEFLTACMETPDIWFVYDEDIIRYEVVVVTL